MKDRYIYQAIFTKEDDGFDVCFTDIEGIHTFGIDIVEAINMAKDALEQYLMSCEDLGIIPPEASAIGSIETSNNQSIYIVDVEIHNVRNKADLILHFDSDKVEMMIKALEKWGVEAQVYQTVEECAELIVALNKHVTRIPTDKSLDNIIDEIADVEMMLAQMRITFGISDEAIQERIAQKFEKLKVYLERE